ncbi:MAG: phosphoribosylaminoimidazolesuccinocarboxamide synthase [Deltaproteobacteria bacterium]|jgi:phosphoribosylaminoimidazole-succinocarboxamide synthase|nr:phosphoribosylaminoimidazolesuccinocarboxamide synthase [Deltaproteobacteria bacterium]
MGETPIFETNFPGLNLVSRGKVRDIYDLGDSLLIVATDRISAFDVVMPDPIPDKGVILTRLSEFWLRHLGGIIDNHLISTHCEHFPEVCRPYSSMLKGRTMWVKKADALPVECIVRGYLAGSGWEDYQRTGRMSGIALPPGLIEAQELPEPLFTPSTKAAQGEHDENISFEKMVELVGREVAESVRSAAVALYLKAREYARERGIILADTKFEFGMVEKKLTLIDEVLTPDSSRFWPADRYRPGGSPESFDKQFLRDYLKSSGWKKTDPAPRLPGDVVLNTRARYLEALKRLSGEDID